VDPAAELRQRLQHPVIPENAANLGALGEIAYGAGVGMRDLIFVKVSSGIGTGLIFDGHLYRGTTGHAGELGHVQIQPNGLLCRCGNRGCLETLVSTSHIIAALQPMYTDTVTIADVIRLVETGDSGATRIVSDAGHTIGRSLADMCDVLNPEAVIVGGELSLAGEVLTDGMREAITRYAQPNVVRAVTVTSGTLKNRAELLGAIALAIHGLGR
jgi:predicted NBD/HSP70 family sugar kinase